jgi:cytochrome c oxidase subunit IV
MGHDLAAIRRLTRSYRNVRGSAQSLPFWLWFLMRHSTDLVGVRLGPLEFVLAVIVVAAVAAMHRYYDRRFGVVTMPEWSGGGGGTLVLVLIAFAALQVASAYWSLPVELGLLAGGIAIAVYAFRHFELERHVLLYALILIALSFSPYSIFDAEDRESFWFKAAAVGIDVICVVAALWSHRTLVKAFERTRLEDVRGAPFSS